MSNEQESKPVTIKNANSNSNAHQFSASVPLDRKSQLQHQVDIELGTSPDWSLPSPFEKRVLSEIRHSPKDFSEQKQTTQEILSFIPEEDDYGPSFFRKVLDVDLSCRVIELETLLSKLRDAEDLGNEIYARIEKTDSLELDEDVFLENQEGAEIPQAPVPIQDSGAIMRVKNSPRRKTPGPFITTHWPLITFLTQEAPFRDLRSGLGDYVRDVISKYGRSEEWSSFVGCDESDEDPDLIDESVGEMSAIPPQDETTHEKTNRHKPYQTVFSEYDEPSRLFSMSDLHSLDDRQDEDIWAPSVMYSANHIPSNVSDEDLHDQRREEINSVLERVYLRPAGDDAGIPSQLYRILAVHPAYLRTLAITHETIMFGHGSLPPQWRHYIGLMTAACHNRLELVYMQVRAFHSHGSNLEWLQGTKHTPLKLRSLFGVINVLSHQPWRIKESDITNLTEVNADGEEGWNMAEIVHALVIITHFHTLSSLSWGCGIAFKKSEELEKLLSDIQLAQNAKPDDENVEKQVSFDSTPPSPINLKEPQSPESVKETSESVAKQELPSIVAEEETYVPHVVHIGVTKHGPAGTVDLVNRLAEWATDKEKAAYDDAGLDALNDLFNQADDAGSGSEIEEVEDEGASEDILKRFKGGPHSRMKHVDFDMKSKAYSVLKWHEFSWIDNGFATIRRFYREAAHLLDEQFSVVYHMTYGRLEHVKDVDTSPFRRALWHYVHRIFGILHDVYFYKSVNLMLNMDLKNFIKKCVCKLSVHHEDDFESVGLDLNPEEKIHIIILASEARRQALLIHGLNAVMKHFTTN